MIQLGCGAMIVSALKEFAAVPIVQKTGLICGGNLANGSRKRARVQRRLGNTPKAALDSSLRPSSLLPKKRH
jgi:hypothetical protein